MEFPTKLDNYSEFPENTNRTGSFAWPDGSTYAGEHKNGHPHGFGTYTWPDGDKYVGFWFGGKRHGLGFHSRRNGFVYVGNFVDNLPQGDGSSIDKQGNSYSGEWKSGVQNGKGSVRGSAEGLMFYGEWKNGRPVFYEKTKLSQKCKLEYKDFNHDTDLKKKISLLPKLCRLIQVYSLLITSSTDSRGCRT